jgi:hypothetical protein
MKIPFSHGGLVDPAFLLKKSGEKNPVYQMKQSAEFTRLLHFMRDNLLDGLYDSFFTISSDSIIYYPTRPDR